MNDLTKKNESESQFTGLKILIIDDDQGLRDSIQYYFEDYDAEIITAINGADGLEKFETHNPEIVLVDLNMPKVSGHKVVEEISMLDSNIPVIVISGTGVIKEVVKAINLGAWDFITKPILNFEELELSILRSIERANLKRENLNYKSNLEKLVKERTDLLEKKSDELELKNKLLKEAKEKAEHSEKLKTEFLTQISHEIRTPINALLNSHGMIKMELEDEANDDINECFGIADRAGKRLIRTIELIINMSELEIGSYQREIEELDIVELVNNISNEYKLIINSDRVEFKFFPKINSAKISVDKYSTNQILINLIDNAVKFTNEGEVEVSIEKEDDNFVVNINDTGIGISEEFLEILFDPFMQEEQGYTRTYEGNGLGMSLVKKYCDLNGYGLVIKSEKNKGTKIKVLIPSNI